MKLENLALPQILECLLVENRLAEPLPRRSCVGSYELEAMECAPKWDDGAVGEGNRIGQTFKLPFEPVRVPRKKRARMVNAAPVWQRQDRGALRVADLEGKSLRP